MTADVDALCSLELALARRDEGSMAGGCAAVPAPDSFELGQSGKRWTRTETLGLVAGELPRETVTIERFEAASLRREVVLMAYDLVPSTADGQPTRSRRSSIGLRRDGCWQLPFHQGTAVPAGLA